MSQGRWIVVSGIGLVVGACVAFRLLHPAEAAVSDAKWSIRFGKFAPSSIEPLARAIAERPAACIELAWKLVESGDTESAAKLLDTASTASPFDTSLAEALAAVQFRSGNVAAANAALERMNRNQLPYSASGQKMRVSGLVQTGDLPAAEKALQGILASNPKDVDALVQLGNVYAARQQFSQAVIEFRHAAELAPKDPQIGLALARSLTWAAMQDARQKVQPINVVVHE